MILKEIEKYEGTDKFRTLGRYNPCFVYFTIYVERYTNDELKNRVEFNFSVFYDLDKNKEVIDEKNVEEDLKECAREYLKMLYVEGVYNKIKPLDKYYLCIDNNSDMFTSEGHLRTVFLEDAQAGLGNAYRVDVVDEDLVKRLETIIDSRYGYEYVIVSVWESESLVQVRDMTDYFYNIHAKYNLYYDFRNPRLQYFTYELDGKKLFA